MFKQFVLGLLLVTLFNLNGAHPGHSCPIEKEVDYPWEEAEGYEECEDFLSGNGKDVFRKHPKPKPLDEICKKYQCPMFQREASSGCGYEERFLARSNWTVTNINLTAPNGYRDAYFRLHGYRSGSKNDRGQKMDMAVPVIKRWWLDENLNILNATMSFYIPPPVQSNPPASTDDQVRVEEWDKAVIYSRAFGGNREDFEHLKQFELLERALTKNKITPNRYVRYTAGFTRPGCGRQRREVILVDSQYMRE